MARKKSKVLISLFASIMIIALVLVLLFWKHQNNLILSPDEMVAIAFMQPGNARKFYPRGNRNALPALYNIIENETLFNVHDNAARVIGYIGGSEDVEKLKDVIDRFEGNLCTMTQKTLYGILEAWAVMARRGVPGAEDELGKWCAPEQWDTAFGISRERQYERASFAIYIFGTFGEADWRFYHDELLEEMKDMEKRYSILSSFPEEAMARAIEKIRKDEKSWIWPSDRKRLRSIAEMANDRGWLQSLEN